MNHLLIKENIANTRLQIRLEIIIEKKIYNCICIYYIMHIISNEDLKKKRIYYGSSIYIQINSQLNSKHFL